MDSYDRFNHTFEQHKDYVLKRTYGISLERYNEILREQNDSCALCGKHKSHFKKSLAVDHNHKTKKIRGLVCFHCNFSLLRRHTLKTAQAMIVYFQKYETEIK